MNTNQMDLLKHLDIIYVEDDKAIQAQFSKTLKLICNNIYSFDNGNDAYKFFLENSVDIIISDVDLKDSISGLELSHLIREHNKTIPIIILSAYTDVEYLLESSKLKLIEYLVKPINFSKLTEVLLKAVEDLPDMKEEKCITFANNYIYDINKKTIDTKQEIIRLTSHEIKLIEFLINNKSTPQSMENIKEYVWDDKFDVSDTAFKALIHKIRQKIGKESLKNISSVGYYLNLAI